LPGRGVFLAGSGFGVARRPALRLFWGRLPNAATILAQALATITTPKGRTLVPEWLPQSMPNSVRAMVADIVFDPVEGMFAA